MKNYNDNRNQKSKSHNRVVLRVEKLERDLAESRLEVQEHKKSLN